MEDPMSKTQTNFDSIKNDVGDTADKAREVINEGLGTAKSALGSGVEELDRRYRRTLSQVQGGAQRFSEQAREQLSGARKSVQERYVQTKDSLVSIDRNTREYVSANPGKSLLLAAGLGFLIGFLTRSRKGDDD
jgi:ElaB/YqjD/DUF883 family membrane-anchored ribosome-binding protein